MLPGFRILFATTVLAISVLIFGLGAAALLRAAHDEFASLPSWRLAQQPMLAPQFEISGPTLAMLRVEALTAKPSPDRTIRQQVIIRDIPRDPPETKPAEIARQDTGSAVKDAEQTPAEPPPAAEAAAALNAQDSAGVRAAEAPVEQTKPSDIQTSEASAPETKIQDEKPQEVKPLEARPVDVKSSEFRISEAKAVDAMSEPRFAEPKRVDSKSSEAKPTETRSSETEASEPRSTETVASLERSTEATASATIPRPAAKKVRRVNSLAIAQRRQIARARAAERARAEQQRQQQNAFPLFGG